MTKLYLIRHAEAEGNLYRRVQGHYDSLVTDTGYLQLEALGKRFAQIPIDAVYSSDLVRTKATASVISKPRGLTIQTTPRLREVYMGRWEDATWAQLEREDREQLTNFSRNPAQWDVGDNEKFEAQQERICSIVSEIAANHPGQTVAIVSHGSIIRTLLVSIMGLSSERFNESAHCDNTGVSLLEAKNGALEIVFMNDNSHLPEEISTFARQSWWRKGGERRDGNMDFLPLDLTDAAQIDRYLRYRRDEWILRHGTLDGFDAENVLQMARAQITQNPRAVVEAVLRGESVGLLELDMIQGENEGAGVISCYYLAPDFRGRNLGVQLMGHAISVYRPLGRRRLRISLDGNARNAAGFFCRYGFVPAEDGGLVLEKDIALPVV